MTRSLIAHARSRTTLAALAVAALLASGIAPLGGAQVPDLPQAVSLGFAYDESFNDEDHGWTTSDLQEYPPRLPPVSSWAWGAPTSGPGFAASGSNVWATTLTGPHGPNECAGIMSPPIDLRDAASASLAWKQWIHTEQGSTGSRFLVDAGLLFVTTDDGATLSVLDPHQAYAGPLNSAVVRCLDDLPTTQGGFGGPPGTTPPPAVYGTLTASLDAHVGSVVRLVFAFGSSAATHRAGWYLDDVAVTVDGATDVEDFEADDGGYTVVGVRPWPPGPFGWEWGEAQGGPATDSPLWGTNLDGTYGHHECAWIESPAFEVGAAASPAGRLNATLSWSQWYRANSIYAAGIVQVGTADGYKVVTPKGGYPSTIGSTVRDQLLACLGVEATQRVFAGLRNTVNTGLQRFEADLTPFMGEEVTVRFLFASGWTTANPTLDWGWYVDDVAVELTLDTSVPVAVPDPDDLTSPRVQAPGWTTGGDLSSWEWGVAASGPSGEVVYATNLTGTYTRNECSFIDSPPVPGALFDQSPTLSFDHWYRIESIFSTSAWDAGLVLVSTDLGETWTLLDLPQYTKRASFSGAAKCIRDAHGLPFPTQAFAGEQTTFQNVAVDLASLAGAPTVQVRFLFSSDSSVVYEGWYLKNVELGGVKLL